MIDTKAIRNKILDLAVRGKLTEQLPEDGTAEELFQQIQAEKQALIKAGKIKKEKPLPEIAEEEIPFEIPDNWKWVRWGNLSYQIQYGYNAPAKEKGRIKMVRITDIQNNKVLWNTVPFCDIDEENIEGYLLKPNNILFARTGGTVGKSFLVENVEEEAVFAGYLIRTSFSSELNAKYLKFFMDSRLYWKQLQDGTTATAQPNCNANTLSKMVVPLPPLAEQKRIVKKIEQAFSVLDTIDELQKKYADNRTVLKNKLIDLAIQGKLTEQLPEDGTAEELYQQIQAEKQTLIKAGKIKKEKPLPEINENEIPFEIPNSWVWIRLGDVMEIARGGSPRPIQNFLTDDPNGINWIKIGDTSKTGKYINSTKEKIIPEGMKKSRFVHKGDFLLTNSMSFGRPYILNIDGCIHDGWLVISNIYQLYSMDYLYYLLSSPFAYSQFSGKVSGAVVKNLNSDKVANSLFPLPPLAEQNRIMVKVEELLKLLPSHD